MSKSKRFFLIGVALLGLILSSVACDDGNDGVVEATPTVVRPVDASGEEFTTTDDTADEIVVAVQSGSGQALEACAEHLDEGGGWQWNVDCQLVGKARLTELGLID